MSSQVSGTDNSVSPFSDAGHDSSNPFRVFRSRDYSLYFGGQLLSQVGTWMQQIALSWLTYKLTNSALMLATVTVAGQLPSLLVMPFAGVFSDRFNRHRIIIFTQLSAMLQAGTLAYLTLSHQLQIWHLIALSVLMGVINAFDMPVRSAFVMDMVQRKEDRPAAIAMNSSLMNVSRLLGPAIAGFVVAALGEGMCFAINAASYVAVISALLFIHGNFEPKQRSGLGVVAELKDGFIYAARTAPIRAPILLLALFGFGGMAYSTLLPVFVKNIGGDANTLGYLSSASAIGSIVGTAILATRKNVVGLGKLALISSYIYGAALFAFAFANSLLLALPVLAVLGATMMLQMGCCNTILQSIVDDDRRGRVMSLFTMAYMGTIPLGSLAAGVIATHFGFHSMLFACSAYCLLVAIVFTKQMPRLRRESRPIYVARGLLKEEEQKLGQGILQTEEDIELATKPAA
ncbi:MAG: MFS transporter [Candidatus Melainabacteria bacterium]|nr:MAG: MFS transporter [Candidatus Melainabacteria bacterium]